MRRLAFAAGGQGPEALRLPAAPAGAGTPGRRGGGQITLIILTYLPLNPRRDVPITGVGNCARHTSTMSGIQVSGLLSNSAFDWKSVVDQLIAIENVPITKLSAQQTTNQTKITALADLHTALTDLQDSVQAMRADNVFSARTVSSSTANTTWKSSSVTGADVGSYVVAVSQLASVAKLRGASNISGGIASSSDVSGVSLATMRTASAVTAGTFTVDGQQVTVESTDSLQDVFDKIEAAAPDVTASYNEVTDKISLTRASGELVLGAGNDTSNFLSVMKLSNSGGGTATSNAALGTLKQSAMLVDSGLTSEITAVDASGDGSFSINGVTIDYNVNTDTLGKIINRINAADAGVVASYDATNDRMVLTNKETGDTGISVSEDSGGLLGALGLSTEGGGSLSHGKNAQFTINGGTVLTSASNTFDSTIHGVDGLSITVNSETTQTLQVESDSTVMNTAIQDFIDKFNAVQDLVETSTKVTVSGSSVSTSVLSDNREIQTWARKLQQYAFDAISGMTGSVTRLDSLGIDFVATTGKLVVRDSGKLATALGDHPDDVENFFLKSETGFVPKMYGYLSTIMSADRTQQSNLGKTNKDLDEQIATLQTRLAAQREKLTNSFMQMLDAQSTAQGQSTYLTNAFFKNSSN